MLCGNMPQKSSVDLACCRSTFTHQHYFDTTTQDLGFHIAHELLGMHLNKPA